MNKLQTLTWAATLVVLAVVASRAEAQVFYGGSVRYSSRWGYPVGGSAVSVRGPFGGRVTAVQGPFGGGAVSVRGPFGGRVNVVRPGIAPVFPVIPPPIYP